MISETIQAQIKDALKSGDQIRLSTLRLLSSELHNAEIAKIGKLTDEEELAVVRKEVKRRKDAIEAYKLGGHMDRAQKEEAEMTVLMEFLPSQLTNLELENIIIESIAEVGATSPQDKGSVISLVLKKAQGRADGATVARLVTEKLS